MTSLESANDHEDDSSNVRDLVSDLDEGQLALWKLFELKLNCNTKKLEKKLNNLAKNCTSVNGRIDTVELEW